MAFMARLNRWLLCAGGALLLGAPGALGADGAKGSEPASKASGEVQITVLGAAQIPPDVEGIGRVGGLSGLVAAGPYAGEANQFLVVSDGKKKRTFYRLTVDLKKAAGAGASGAYTLGVALDRPIEMECEPTDSESIVGVAPVAREGNGAAILVGFERPPAVIRFPIKALREGATMLQGAPALAIPADVLSGARHNRAIEAMAWTDADQDWGSFEHTQTLWVAMEAAIESDGPEATMDSGTLCRVLEYDADDREHPAAQYFYETDPAPRGMLDTPTYDSLAELSGLGDGRVLFLERGASLPRGWHANIYVCDGTTETRPGTALPVLVKKRVCDLREIGLPIIGNMEGMAVGPTIASVTGDDSESGRLLLMVADDNFGDDGQVGSQVIALRLTTGP